MAQMKQSQGPPRVPRAVLVLVTIAGLLSMVAAGVAIAKTVTLHVAKNAAVRNQVVTTRENIVVDAHGHPAYSLTGDSIGHPGCTKANGCFRFWPPMTVASVTQLSKAPGVGGRLGAWRHSGILQVTLAGHPLYRFAGDGRGRAATGEGIRSFGGTWHAVKATGAAGGSTSTSGTTTTTTTTSTTSPACLYPPCY